MVGVVSSALLVLTGWSPAGASPDGGQVDGAPAWTSGASGAGVADGSFDQWRGSPVSIAATWADSAAGQLELWPLQGEFATWSGDLEIAIGAIDHGETWAQAAQGAYDDRWAESLRRAAALWSSHEGTLYIRFAHEFNGSWFPWSVTPDSVGDFIAAWHRFRALQQQLFPTSQLVFSPNRESAGSFGTDWRQAFPGPGQADVVSVSYYNGWPFLDTAESFQETALSYDQFGGPRGIQRHLEFAREVGLPFAVSEWGSHAAFGDSAVWMEQMHAFFAANAGTGPGQLRYEVYFNVVQDGNAFSLFPDTRLPRSAEVYARLW